MNDRREFLKGLGVFSGLTSLAALGVPRDKLLEIEKPALISESRIIKPDEIPAIGWGGEPFNLKLQWESAVLNIVQCRVTGIHMSYGNPSAMHLATTVGSPYGFRADHAPLFESDHIEMDISVRGRVL